jgi:hypothetical protein
MGKNVQHLLHFGFKGMGLPAGFGQRFGCHMPPSLFLSDASALASENSAKRTTPNALPCIVITQPAFDR